MKNNQQDVLYRFIYYSKSALHDSGDVLAHHQEHWTVFTVSGSVHPSCCRLVFPKSWNCFAVSSALKFQLIRDTSPQQLGRNTTRFCKYSQVLLMMGENIARNM